MQIDIVYTWVNHLDPQWQALRNQADSSTSTLHATASDEARFHNRDEIFYSIQSVKIYAPWVRNIFIVTNCTLPAWAKIDKQVIAVSHEDIFPDVSYLPTFNSHAIESCLQNIPGLAEHFLYLNDDVFILKPCEPQNFFPREGAVNVFATKHEIACKTSKNLRPSDFAAINSVSILERDFNFTPQKKLHHAPFPLLKSTLKEIEQQYEKEILSTRSNRFRHNDDLPLATTLHAYYCLAKGKAEFSNLKARYIDIGDWLFLGLIHPFSPLIRGKYTFLCLNEVKQISFGAGIRDRIIQNLMRKLFSSEVKS